MEITINMRNLVDEESDGKSDGGSNSSKVKIAAVVLSVRSNLQFNYKIFCRYAYQKLDHMNMATYTICQHVGYVDAYI